MSEIKNRLDFQDKNGFQKLLFKDKSEEQLRPNGSYSKSPRDQNQNLARSQSSIMNAIHSESNYLTGWGNPRQGQLGTGQQTKFHINDFGINVHQVDAGENHTIIINSKNEIFSTGQNNFGQLGIEGVYQISKPRPIQGLKDVKISQISCGSDFTYALSNKGEVFSWGLNLKGQLGIGGFENQFVPQLVYQLLPFGNSNVKAKKIQENQNQNVLKKQQSDLNYENALQERSPSIDNMVEQIQIIQNQKSQSQSKLKELGESSFLLGNDEVVTQIACGTLHTIVSTNKHRIFSCGFGETFALGHQSTQSLDQFQQINPQFFKSKQSLQVIAQNEKIDKIDCGLSHSACLIGGKVFMWGIAGNHESLIFKTPTLIDFKETGQQQVIIDLKLGDGLSVFLNAKGEVFTLGENIDGQLCQENIGLISKYPIKVQSLPLISQISCGKNYVMALSSDLKYIFGWGNNQFGQITGHSTGQNPIITSPFKIVLHQCEPVRLECGSYHTLLLSNNLVQIKEMFSGAIQAYQQQEEQGDSFRKKNQQSNEDLSEIQKEMIKQKKDLEAKNKQNMSLQQNLNEARDYNLQLVQQISQLQAPKKKKDTGVMTDLPDVHSIFNQGSKKKANQRSQSKFEIKGVDMNNEQIKNCRTFNSNLEIDYNELKNMQKIAEGGYGIIYKAKWREAQVAVKMFKMDPQNSHNALKDFLSECHAMESLRHPNIVMFLGATVKPPELSIVQEYCEKGSLWSVLQNEKIPLTWNQKRQIALDAARGINYLHLCNPPILHRDLKSLNLLLDDNMHCKIADFGWSRSLGNYMTGKIGTYQWMAPEVIQNQKYTEKADVFSFGIILWEIGNREPPYKHIGGYQVSVEVVNKELRPKFNPKTPQVWKTLAMMCWDSNPDKRPSFKEICIKLEEMTFNEYQ